MSASVVSSLCVVMPVWTSPGLRTHRTLRQGAVPEPAAESEYSSAHPPCVRGMGGWAGRVMRLVVPKRTRQNRIQRDPSVVELATQSLRIRRDNYARPIHGESDRQTGPRTPSEPMSSWPLHRPNKRSSARRLVTAHEKAHRLVIHHARRGDAGSRG